MSRRQRDARDYARRMRVIQERSDARRGRMRWATTAIVVVVLAFGVLVVAKLGGAGEGGETAAPVPTGDAAAAVVSGLTSVPAATLNSVARGNNPTLPDLTTGQEVLKDGGKPLVLYVGAEYCPFCAAQRWPVVIALSRFGTFQGLTLSHSASDDTFPDTPTVSFHGSTYTSQYLTFQGVETSTNERKGGSYAPLDTLTPQQQQIVAKYNAPPYVDAQSAGAIPFLTFANQGLMAGSSFSPQLLKGMTHAEIVSAAADPQSSLGRTVDGNANAMTALLCRLTGGQPGDVCTSPAVTAFEKDFANVSVK
ncbi:DUF929 family protein [Dactylosporangium sp. AC04546]|uniref:DUF929 family protein n=1 Tax=Dactylosporangium sp. AC04546 TaxID=2862460 RepID=UPI001EDCD930|nr:DUF929 family protein [Dactylosporangium sp. AC04546]WVK81972.1 DUF929 family protein [Dactylosporangium sp. AC04546]